MRSAGWLQFIAEILLATAGSVVLITVGATSDDWATPSVL